MSYSIESITESIGARRMGNAPATIDWLLTDSRSLNFLRKHYSCLDHQEK